MFTRLRSALASLVFLREEEAHYTARFVAFLLPVSIALMALLIALRLIAGDFPERLAVGAPVIVANAAAWWLLRRGKVRLASLTFIAGGWVVTTYALITRDGVRAPAYITYLVLTTYAAFLVTPAAALAVFGLCLLAGLGVVVAAYTGGLPVPSAIHTPATLYASYSASMLMIILIVLVITAEYRDVFRKLRAGEAKCRLWFQATRDPVLVLDTDGRFTEANEAAVRAFGVSSPADLVGRAPADFSPEFQPDGAPSSQKAEQMIRAAFAQGSTQFEWVHRRQDGAEFLADVALTVIPLQPTNVVMAHLRDLSEHKRAQAALRESEERFRSLVEATSDWIWEVDARGVYTYASPKVRDLLGYEPAEVLGRTPYDLMPPEEAERVAEALRSCFGEGRPFSHVENTNLHKDGHPVVLETSGVPVFDERGVLRGFHGIDRDISEQKQARDALRESEERFRAIVESTKDWIWFSDTAGVHRYSNGAVQDLLGYTPDEIVGSAVFEFMHPDDMPLGRAQMERAIAERTGWSALEIRWRHRDGTYRYLESAAAPAFSASGDLIGWYGADRDVTARREAEAALRESEEQYRALFEMLPVTAVIHQDRRVALANPASMTTFRVADPSRVIGQEVSPYLGGRTREQIEERLRATRRGEPEAPDHYFATMQRADGEEFPAEVFAADVPYQGRPATQVVILDITESTRMQQALRDSEARLRALFAAMSDVILVVDAEGRYLEIAPTKPELLYRPAEEVLGKTVHEIFPAEQADYFLSHIQEALTTRRTTQAEYTFVVGGEEHCFSAAISPLSPDTAIVVVRDVTAVVEQRNRLLAAERARADLAEHLNEEINHRARNNLAMVSGLLNMQALEEPNAELAARLREAVARIRTFVDIHEKIYAAGAEEANLREVIQQVTTTLRTIFAATAAEFSVEGTPGLFPTRTVTNLAVVTNELLTNALKYGGAEAGRPTQIRVRLERTGGRLRISVWNSGTPVPDGFDATAQKGMGLRLVAGIAEQYGASFRVRPAEGGTVAELVLDEAALD
jgi:PAS domain S-box-containing protein